MQAIARANRVHEGKNNGMIVDYCGILKHLRKALATFAGAQPGGGGEETDPARPDEELLAISDLLRKNELAAADIKRIKAIATDLLETLKEEKLRVDQWREKESTRDAVKTAIHDFLYSDATGLPVDFYEEDEVQARADEVFRHVYRVYPTIPSPYFEASVVA
jgi:type I site-specific restriction-modification system R (restriction) subunit